MFVIDCVCSQDVGRLAEAKRAYEEAIRLRPNFAIAFGNLASCFFDEGNMDMAVKCVSYVHNMCVTRWLV